MKWVNESDYKTRISKICNYFGFVSLKKDAFFIFNFIIINMIGKVFKQRNKNDLLPIARNKIGKLISTNIYKINRPYVILFSNENVYFLSVKTVKKENIESTYLDKENVLVPNGIYNDNHFSSIDTSTINVMNRGLFESLYEIDNRWNDYQLSIETYNRVMEKLYINRDNLIYHEVDHFNLKKHKTIWKSNTEALKNKTYCKQLIITYHHLEWNEDMVKFRDNPQIYYQNLEDKYQETWDEFLSKTKQKIKDEKYENTQKQVQNSTDNKEKNNKEIHKPKNPFHM